MSPVLVLDYITFSQSGKQLLFDICFSVAKGNIVGLVGINGAGKSTTLKIAAGTLLPSQGVVKRQDNLRIGYLPESPPIIENWTVSRYLRHACSLHKLPKSEHYSAITAVTSQCDLASITNQTIRTLSKGNLQRVAIAQAIIHQPDLLILDEPTSGLDPQQISQFREIIHQLQPQMAIILSSHIMQEITALCDTAIIIHEGKQLGKLDIKKTTNKILIIFANPIANTVFSDITAWHSGEGKYHQFSINNQAEKNALLTICLEKQLPIDKITSVEHIVESQFLSLINNGTNYA
ncbi:MAG: ABC transporter ATP-binding protein [Ostreibacterium sp.]